MNVATCEIYWTTEIMILLIPNALLIHRESHIQIEKTIKSMNSQFIHSLFTDSGGFWPTLEWLRQLRVFF